MARLSWGSGLIGFQMGLSTDPVVAVVQGFKWKEEWKMKWKLGLYRGM